jgi:hypothetical protein
MCGGYVILAMPNPQRRGRLAWREPIITSSSTKASGRSLAGRKVLPTLEELVEMVHGIIEAFASLVDERIA